MSDELTSLQNEEPMFSSLGKMGGAAQDAGIEFFISSDEMYVIANLTPPAGQGKFLIANEIEDALSNFNVTQGVILKNLQEAVFRCNMEKRKLDKVLIAKGRLPVSEKSAYLRLEAKLFQESFPDEFQIKSVDYKERTSILVVKKGELLASAVPSRPGREGVTVRGSVIPFEKKTMKNFRPGSHTVFLRGKVFAKIPGRFFVEGEVFDISDHLEVAGDVDYSTGHLLFPGSISIAGRVLDGFKVISGGEVNIKETLDATEVFCKKDLIVGGGILGRNRGIIRVGGSISAVFIENCHVESLGDIHIKKAILHSDIFCNGNLKMDEGSRIVTSKINVKGNLYVSQLGNDAGPCLVKAGMDFVVMRKIDQMKILYHDLEESWTSAAEDKKIAIHENMQKLMTEINEIQSNVVNTETFEISVKGHIYPGVVIEMGFAQLEIHTLVSAKTFRLSEDRKAILQEKYTPSSVE